MINLSKYNAMTDYPLHKHRHIKRKCYWACINETGDPLTAALVTFISQKDTKDFYNDLMTWCFNHRIVISKPDNNVWLFIAQIKTKLKPEPEQLKLLNSEVLSTWKKRLFIVEFNNENLASLSTNTNQQYLTKLNQNLSNVRQEYLLCLNKTLTELSQTKDAKNNLELMSFQHNLQYLVSNIYAQSLTQLTLTWINASLLPLLNKKIANQTQADDWAKLPALFSFPEKLSHAYLANGMMNMSTGLAEQDESLVTSIMWTQLWRYIYETMAIIEGTNTGTEVVKNWWQIKREILNVQGKLNQDDDVAKIELDIAYDDIAQIAEQVHHNLKLFKNPDRIIEYIWAFQEDIGLDLTADIVAPVTIDAEVEDFNMKIQQHFISLITDENILNKKERDACQRKIIEQGASMSRQQYLETFGVSQQKDDYYLKIDKNNQLSGTVVNKLMNAISNTEWDLSC